MRARVCVCVYVTKTLSFTLNSKDLSELTRPMDLTNADCVLSSDLQATNAMDGLADVNEFNQKYLDGRTCHNVLPHLHLVKGIRQSRGYVSGSSDGAESCGEGVRLFGVELGNGLVANSVDASGAVQISCGTHSIR